MRRSIVGALAVGALAALAACYPDQGPRPSPTQVYTAPGTPVYVARCVDVDGGPYGPCADPVGSPADVRQAMWVYVPPGHKWPSGQALPLCPTEDGGPVPCMWVPAVQGNGLGDSGAYVYGVPGYPGAITGPQDVAQ